jgi:hypothetical protein
MEAGMETGMEAGMETGMEAGMEVGTAFSFIVTVFSVRRVGNSVFLWQQGQTDFVMRGQGRMMRVKGGTQH